MALTKFIVNGSRNLNPSYFETFVLKNRTFGVTQIRLEHCQWKAENEYHWARKLIPFTATKVVASAWHSQSLSLWVSCIFRGLLKTMKWTQNCPNASSYCRLDCKRLTK